MRPGCSAIPASPVLCCSLLLQEQGGSIAGFSDKNKLISSCDGTCLLSRTRQGSACLSSDACPGFCAPPTSLVSLLLLEERQVWKLEGMGGPEATP